jgi:Subtilase family/Thrombospondin type 3 repeat
MADDTRVTRSRWVFACAVVLMWACGCAVPGVSNAAELIVKRDAGLSAGQRQDLRQDAGVTYEQRLSLPDSELVSVPDARKASALAALNADSHVVYAAPNVRLHVASSPYQPTDPWWRFQWGLENFNTDADIDVLAAWNRPGNGFGAGVEVGVVDQQVDTDHPDLAGRVDMTLRKSVLTQSDCAAPTPTGADDHGTHVAGTVAADRDNGIGITGVAPEAQVVPIRAFDNCGGASLTDVLAGLTYAGEHHLPVVVASFATNPLDQEDSPTVNDAFAQLFETYEDTLFVVAAGNQGSDDANLPVYPCSARAPLSRFGPANMLCVGMSDANDAPDCLSNVGSSVDLFAPGRQVYSTVRPDPGKSNSVESNTGTSMSAAIVAGVAALAHAADPESAGAQLKGLLRRSVDGKSEMTGLSSTGGRINAAYAVGVVPGGLGSGGPGAGRPWASCDVDHDGEPYGGVARFVADKCPTVAGNFHGCPDADEDGVLDGVDNCAGVPNLDQADMDADGKGDLCDNDQDGDFKAEADDGCPRQYALTADGCPPDGTNPDPPGDPITQNPPGISTPVPVVTPTPTPGAPTAMKVTIAFKVSHKVAKVTVNATRPATFMVKVERRKGKGWTRLALRSMRSGRALTVKKIVKGSYRVTATATGVKQTVKKFKV